MVLISAQCLWLLNAIRERFAGLLYSSASPWGRADLHWDLSWLCGGVEANGGWLVQKLGFNVGFPAS